MVRRLTLFLFFFVSLFLLLGIPVLVMLVLLPVYQRHDHLIIGIDIAVNSVYLSSRGLVASYFGGL